MLRACCVWCVVCGVWCVVCVNRMTTVTMKSLGFVFHFCFIFVSFLVLLGTCSFVCGAMLTNRPSLLLFQQMLARDGPQGDFMAMAKAASVTHLSGKGEGRRESAEERRANKKNEEGKQCAFCGLKFVVQNTTKFSSSPTKRTKNNRGGGGHSGGKDGKDGDGGGGGKDEDDDGFNTLVPNFGYTFTERMMLDVIKHMVHRGVVLNDSVCDELRVAFGSKQSGEMTIRAKSGGNGMAQKVCRLCYEVQNSQRALEGLGRQYARSMGVPNVPRIRSSKMMMVGPGASNGNANGNVKGGPAVYAPFSKLYGYSIVVLHVVNRRSGGGQC